jgi:hypothetical protein
VNAAAEIPETLMTLIPPMLSGTKVSEVTTPKTALAFYAGLLLIDGVVGISATVVCASVSSLNYLVPWVLGVTALVFVGILCVVIWLNINDPEKLQLGEVTSRDYVQIQQAKAIRGDSLGGQYVEAAPVGEQQGSGTPGAPPEVPAPNESAADDGSGSSSDPTGLPAPDESGEGKT